MRVAHVSDPHIGFRRHYRMTATHVNQREYDVAQAFRATIDGVIAARPVLVVLAGDIFHAVSPGNIAIVFAHRQLQRLRTALPETPVVMIAGDHDSPHRADSGCILGLFEGLGIDVAMNDVREFVYPALDLRVVAAPDTAVKAGQPFAPHGPERYQVLVAHGEAGNVIPGKRDTHKITAEQLAQPWSYCALGHYHTTSQIADRAWYAGAIEYTTTDVWGELKDGERHGVVAKGWLLADLDDGTVKRQSLRPARPVYDLPEINAADLEPKQVSDLIVARLEAQDITDAIVRLNVVNVPRLVTRGLDHEYIRKAKAWALHLQIDYRQPDVMRTPAGETIRIREPLEQTVARHLGAFALMPGLDRGRFVALGSEVMAEAVEVEAEKMARRAG